MNSTIFPWKTLAIASAVLVALFIGGFWISGYQPVQSRQSYVKAIKAPDKFSAAIVIDTNSESINVKKSAKIPLPIAIAIKVPTRIKRIKPGYTSTTVAANGGDTSSLKTSNGNTAEAEAAPIPLNEMLVLDITAPKKTPAKKPVDNAGKEADPLNRSTNEAYPQVGWKNFEKYLNTKALSLDGKEGSVQLSFVVSPDDKTGDFKIITSLSELDDEKAIQIIKDGPGWMNDSDTKAKTVVINVEFHL